jgi:UDP-MurNAc hydroxylase
MTWLQSEFWGFMKITNIGGATAIIEHQGKRMLFDPWLDDGIFYGSWYHYPPCRVQISELGRFDYVYISHIHEDHCSAGTIKHLNKDAEIILLDRKPNYVAKFLERNKFGFQKIHLIKEKTPHEIAPGLVVDMLRADPEHDYNYLIDSALVLKWDGFTLYNANDCAPYPGVFDYIRTKYGTLDLALLPYTGGSGYPTCYTDLSEEMKRKEAMRIADGRLNWFVTAYEALKPRYIMPFADQYVVAGSRAHLNKFLPHPPTPGAVYEPMKAKGYDNSLLLLNSGQSFDFDKKQKTPNDAYYFHTEDDREAYIQENLLDKKYEYESLELDSAVPVERLVQYARERLWSEQEKDGYFPDYRYYLQVTDQNRTFEVDLKQKGIIEIDGKMEKKQPYVKMSCPSNLFVLMLIGQISWNMADAALFIDYERVPNKYDPKVYAFINFLRV